MMVLANVRRRLGWNDRPIGGRESSRLLLCLLLSITGSQAAFAQVQPGGLSQIPSGLRQNRSGPGEVAGITLDAMTIADSTAEGEAAGDPEHQTRQLSTALMARFTYRPVEKRHLRVQFGVQTGARYYPDLHEFTGMGQNGQLSVAVPLGRSTVTVTQSISYSPYFSLVPTILFVPDDSVPVSAVEVDYSVASNPTVNSNTNVGLIWALGARSGLSVWYGLNRTMFTDETGVNLTGQGAGGRFGYRLTKFLNFHAGYSRRLGAYAPTGFVDPFVGSPLAFDGSPGVFAGQDTFVDDFDIGVDFNNNRTIRLGRKTTLGFGTGSSIVTQANRKQFYLTGNATLTRQLGRTGSVAVGYDRGIQMIDGLTAPVFADSIRGSASASLAAKVSLTSSIGYTFGAVGLGSANNGYDTLTGSSEVNVGLTRTAALYFGFGYTANTLGSSVQLPLGVPNVYRRWSARVGASLRVPLIQRQPSRERN
jgi:hypothetical protein